MTVSQSRAPHCRYGNGRRPSEVPKTVARSVLRPDCMVIERKFSDDTWDEDPPNQSPGTAWRACLQFAGEKAVCRVQSRGAAVKGRELFGGHRASLRASDAPVLGQGQDPRDLLHCRPTPLSLPKSLGPWLVLEREYRLVTGPIASRSVIFPRRLRGLGLNRRGPVGSCRRYLRNATLAAC